MALSIKLTDALFDDANVIGQIETEYRYWRLYVPSTGGGGFVAAEEIQLRSLPGGADQTGVGDVYTASTQNTGGGNIADVAFDNNAATFWRTTVAPPGWIAVDFGAGNEKYIQEIYWLPWTALITTAPTVLTVQHSVDGTTWVDGWTQSGITGWTAGVAKIFTKP